MRRFLRQQDFSVPISESTLTRLNELIEIKHFQQLKAELPEGFLQRRIVCTNYKTLRNIISQRKTHKLLEWRLFISEVMEQVEHPELLVTK
jgi:hypothetical protein